MKALEFVRENRDTFLAELEEFIRIPSVSTQPNHKPNMERAAAWLRKRLLEAGFPRVEIKATKGHPIVYAEWMAAGDGKPTILVYGHYDVQPPDPLEEWKTPPFEPTVMGEDLFGRGTSDDKGQVYAHVKAVQAFREMRGAPPVNVKCIFEGEEEAGSVHLYPFIRQNVDLLAADVAVISDTSILGKDQPSIVYALRGLSYLEVEVTGPDHDLHSGSFGGAVLNPINALCHIVAKLQDENGRITIPGFYDRVRDLAPDERAEMAKIPFDRQTWLDEAGVKTDWGEPAYTIVERLSARPTLDVNGIWGGYTGAGAKTVLPGKAFAKISMRLVADQDPEEIFRLVEKYVTEIAPPAVDVEVRYLHGGDPATVRRDSRAMRAACRAYAESFGREPVFTREGGSIPVVAAFQNDLGIETILMGFGLPDDRLHSPNEKFHLPNFYRGIETIIRFMAYLGGSVPQS